MREPIILRLLRPSFKPSRRFGLRRSRLALALLALAATAPLGACRDSARALGGTPAEIRRNGDLFFGAIAARFGNIERSPKAADSRRKMIRAALVPSRAFDDTSVWTARPTADSRSLLVAGRATERGYYFWDDPAPPGPVHPGDSWHVMQLTRLGPELFRWNTAVSFAVGEAGAVHVADLFGAVVGLGEGRPEARVRADYRSAFPRTTAALGQLATMDSLRLTPLPDGTTLQMVGIRIHPDRLKRRYPHLAAYVRKYVSTGRARLVVRDRAGVPWMTIDARDERIGIVLRSRGGRLAPLAGEPRPLPDSMQVVADMSMKVKLWTVGFDQLVTDLAIEHSATHRAWTLRARREPRWHLPLIAERLLRTPLKRPFMGHGAMFRVGVRDERGTTLLVRSTELVVEESGILRFLNSLAGTVLDDYDPRTERERDAFLREVFLAMRADVRALTE